MASVDDSDENHLNAGDHQFNWVLLYDGNKLDVAFLVDVEHQNIADH